MTMSLFLQNLAFVLLTQAIPTAFAIYLAIRLAIKSGELNIVTPKRKGVRERDEE